MRKTLKESGWDPDPKRGNIKLTYKPEVSEVAPILTSAFISHKIRWGDSMTMRCPKFPEEQRDLAIVVDKNVSCGEIEKTMKEACKYITSIKLFDIYEGAQIGEDKKSMAFTVLFTPKDEAFGPESVDAFVKKILKQLGKNLGAELRS